MESDMQTDSAPQGGLNVREDPGQSRLDRYQRALEGAHRELEEEKHKPLGFFDDILNLLCWIETPEERLHKNHLAKVTMNELGLSKVDSGATADTWNVFSAVKPPRMVRSLAKRVAFAYARSK